MDRKHILFTTVMTACQETLKVKHLTCILICLILFKCDIKKQTTCSPVEALIKLAGCDAVTKICTLWSQVASLLCDCVLRSYQTALSAPASALF